MPHKKCHVEIEITSVRVSVTEVDEDRQVRKRILNDSFELTKADPAEQVLGSDRIIDEVVIYLKTLWDKAMNSLPYTVK